MQLTERKFTELGNVFNHEASQNVKLMMNDSKPSFDSD
jgi:hypothetical protein